MNAKLKEVGNRIRKARKQANLSQSQLSEKLDISPSHMSDIENGKVNVSLDIFMKVTESLNVSADWLLRTDIPEVNFIISKEIQDITSNCSNRDLHIILKTMQTLKSALQENPPKSDY